MPLPHVKEGDIGNCPMFAPRQGQGFCSPRKYWVAVKELSLSYHNIEIYIHTPNNMWFLDYGNLSEVPYQQPRIWASVSPVSSRFSLHKNYDDRPRVLVAVGP